MNKDELEIALRVLEEAGDLDHDDPSYVALRRATSGFFKAAKRERRLAHRQAVAAADRAVVELTGTGSASRIDDETAGLPLTSTAKGATAGTLVVPRACYICKQKYVDVDAFYHQLCPGCAAISHEKRAARTDLTGRRALLTGGRAKIGMYIALRLLRDGADLTITTRFPHDAVRRFAGLPDSSEWLHRLRVVGIDLRDPAQVIGLAEDVRAKGPLDILINNAAQTVRRTPGAYAPIAEAERTPLPAALQPDDGGPELMTFGHTSDLHPAALVGSVDAHPVLAADAATADQLTALAMTAGSADLDRIDAGGLVPDVVDTNSWVQGVGEIGELELLEVQLCNQTAPFILISRLRPALAASSARRTYVVNVSAMEGQFARNYKGAGHPHTNMSKAALNMLTYTSAAEMLTSDRILMTAVDTGWITDERPHVSKQRLAAEGFKAPLDLEDGAARVYDPIVRGEAGEDVHGVFLKDYLAHPW
ncbi:MAG TPA: SDR family NAD(P)-dependent oxidoreductase [Nocardioides sp.]|nr:SDR family NAD(P)-dependent oxidoreductase [Nocardioides sp.]